MSGPEKDTYLTLSEPGEGLFKEKGSKFYSYALHTPDETAVKAELERLRQEHHTSRHVCYAYVLGNDGKTTRANDAGEPANSAGKPILNQITGHELTNCLVVVVRYFGGVKLGVGGLIQAYRESARLALNAAQVETKVMGIDFLLLFDYAQMSGVMRILREENIDVQSPEFAASCQLRIWVRKNRSQKVLKRLQQIANLQVETLA
ncbi:MAG: IMPACT family protein [Salibacteraceae bacterium]